MQLLEGLINRTGGIGGRPVKFVIADDTSNPQVALQLAQGVMQQKAPVLIGPGLVATCNAVGAMANKVGPVVFCLSPGIKPAAGTYVFADGASGFNDALAVTRYLHKRNWKHVGLIVTTDATGQSFEEDFDQALALPGNGASVTVTDRQHFTPTDISIAALADHMKNSHVDAVVVWCTGAPFGTALRGLHDAGYDGPVISGIGNMIFSQLAQYAQFAPSELYFSGRRAASLSGVRPGPIHDALETYYRTFAATNARPDFANMLAWDPTVIVVDALRHFGPGATAGQVRSYITSLHSWAGVNGIYDFRDGSQRGVGINSVVIDRWNANTNSFTAVSRPAVQ